MNLKLNKSIVNRHSAISITGSKSETNRLLLLQALYSNISLENTSNSDDSEVMIKALQNFQLPTSSFQLIDIHHAGTAMRFLTAYFAQKEGKKVILIDLDMRKPKIHVGFNANNSKGISTILIGKDTAYSFTYSVGEFIVTDSVLGIFFDISPLHQNFKVFPAESIIVPFSQLFLFKGKYDLENYIIGKKNYKRL